MGEFLLPGSLAQGLLAAQEERSTFLVICGEHATEHLLHPVGWELPGARDSNPTQPGSTASGPSPRRDFSPIGSHMSIARSALGPRGTRLLRTEKMHTPPGTREHTLLGWPPGPQHWVARGTRHPNTHPSEEDGGSRGTSPDSQQVATVQGQVHRFCVVGGQTLIVQAVPGPSHLPASAPPQTPEPLETRALGSGGHSFRGRWSVWGAWPQIGHVPMCLPVHMSVRIPMHTGHGLT